MLQKTKNTPPPRYKECSLESITSLFTVSLLQIKLAVRLLTFCQTNTTFNQLLRKQDKVRIALFISTL